MKALLFFFFLQDGVWNFQISEPFDNINDCFVAREGVIETYGRPMINYMTVCVQTTEGTVPERDESVR